MAGSADNAGGELAGGDPCRDLRVHLLGALLRGHRADLQGHDFKINCGVGGRSTSLLLQYRDHTERVVQGRLIHGSGRAIECFGPLRI